MWRDAPWQVSTGSGVVLAVIDSGLLTSHVDFAGQIWANNGETCGDGTDNDNNRLVDDCQGWDFGNNDANPNPDLFDPRKAHGTHVAGIIGAARNNVGVVGVAPNATVMPFKVSTRK